MKLDGKIKLIKDTQTFDSGFTKRELVLTTDDKYPQDILIEFLKDNCERLDDYKVNDEVTIHINIRGREWINKQGEAVYFNSILGWRIEKQETIEEAAATTPSVVQPVVEQDDLPF